MATQPVAALKLRLVSAAPCDSRYVLRPFAARRKASPCGPLAHLAGSPRLLLVSVAARSAATGVEASALRAASTCVPPPTLRGSWRYRALRCAGGARPPPKGSPSPRRGSLSARLAPHRAGLALWPQRRSCARASRERRHALRSSGQVIQRGHGRSNEQSIYYEFNSALRSTGGRKSLI